MVSTETLQVNDYSKYHMASFDEVERKERREVSKAEGELSGVLEAWIEVI